MTYYAFYMLLCNARIYIHMYSSVKLVLAEKNEVALV